MYILHAKDGNIFCLELIVVLRHDAKLGGRDHMQMSCWRHCEQPLTETSFPVKVVV